MPRTAVPEEQREPGFEELLIAEGSDWCWWYGPEHDRRTVPSSTSSTAATWPTFTRGQPIGRLCRIGRYCGERGRGDHVGRGGGPHDPLGHVALAALLDQLHQAVLFKGLDVVVDLLPGKPKPRRECGRGVWLGQLREHPGPDWIERNLRSCGIPNHCDVLHARTLSPTIPIVKTARTVQKNFLSNTRRGHAPQLPRTPCWQPGAPPGPASEARASGCPPPGA